MSETKSLFRKEVINYSHRSDRGSILIINPFPHLYLVIFVCTLLCALVTFLLWGSYTKSETVIGVLQPTKGLSRIIGEQSGTVVDLLVTEGHKVTVGSPMLRVKTDRQLVGGSMEKRLQEQLKVAIASFQQQISQQQQLAQLEKQRLALLQEDLKHQAGFLTEQIATQKQHADTLEQELKGLEILLSKGHLTQVDYNAKLTVLLSSKLDLQSLQKEKVSLYSRLTEAGNQYERVDVDTGVSLSSLQAVIAELRERSIETEGRSSYLITAPVSGTVTSVLVRKGGLIVPGRQILAILPEQSKLQAELYVPTRAIGFTTKGQPVQIRYPAFPYQKFGFHRGQVSDISRTIIAPDDIPAPASVTEPVYRITVALDHQSVTAFGEQYPLQSGMLLSADLMGEKG